MLADDFRRKIREIIDNLTGNQPQDVLRIANDVTALIKLRIQRSGKNKDGLDFAPYTQQYAKRRAAQGYQVSRVDFTVTGRLFANVRPYLEGRKLNGVVVSITAKEPDNIKKLAGATKKRGNILLPSKKEVEAARQANRQRLLNYITFK